MTRIAESGVPSQGGIDFTRLAELFIVTRDARWEDIGAMANIFMKYFQDDRTAQLLYPRDGIWPVVVDMLRAYLADDYTTVRVAWDEHTDTIVGWTSVSIVALDDDDYFKFCDSTIWAARELLRKESQLGRGGPLHVDEMRRAGLITELRKRNRDGQKRHSGGQHLVINTFAMHPDVVEEEIPEIAYKLMDDTRELAKQERLPLWGQFSEYALGDLEELFQEIGFAEVGSFALDINRYANEEQRSRCAYFPSPIYLCSSALRAPKHCLETPVLPPESTVLT